MPDRASVTQAVQFGVESTPGTAVAANKTLRSVSLEDGPQGDVDIFTPDGHKYAVLAVPGMEWTGADIKGKPTYAEEIYLLNSLVTTGTISADGTNGKKHTFTSADTTADSPKTLTIERGDSVRAHKWAYGLVTDLTWEYTRKAVSLTGKMIGQRISDGIAMTASPSDIALKPVAPKTVDIYLDDTSGALGTTKLLRVFKATFGIGDRYEAIWPLNSAAASFDGHVETKPSGKVSLLLEADATGMGLLTAWRNGTAKFLRIQALGDTIAGGVASTYTHRNDAAVFLDKVSEFKDEDGIFAIQFDCMIQRDSTYAKAFELVRINEIAAL